MLNAELGVNKDFLQRCSIHAGGEGDYIWCGLPYFSLARAPDCSCALTTEKGGLAQPRVDYLILK